MSNTGFVNFLLTKEWCENPPGTVVDVDPERAKWMAENGYGRRADPAAELPEIPRPVEVVAAEKEQAEAEAEYDDGYGDDDPDYDPIPYDPEKEV